MVGELINFVNFQIKKEEEVIPIHVVEIEPQKEPFDSNSFD